MPDSYLEPLQTARAALVQAHTLIADEMRDYPTPISGCDAQYTHLVGERQRIAAALDALGQPVFVATPRTLAPQSGVESR